VGDGGSTLPDGIIATLRGSCSTRAWLGSGTQTWRPAARRHPACGLWHRIRAPAGYLQVEWRRSITGRARSQVPAAPPPQPAQGEGPARRYRLRCRCRPYRPTSRRTRPGVLRPGTSTPGAGSGCRYVPELGRTGKSDPTVREPAGNLPGCRTSSVRGALPSRVRSSAIGVAVHASVGSPSPTKAEDGTRDSPSAGIAYGHGRGRPSECAPGAMQVAE